MNYVIPGPARSISSPKAQRGVVLIVGLIMVLLISLVALAAIRGSGLQELMAGNVRDRNLAFQAAEAGLREAEARFAPGATHPQFNGSQTGLMQAITGSMATGFWDDYDWSESIEADVDLSGVSRAPRYVIEEVTYTPIAGADGGAIDFASVLDQEDATLYRSTSAGYGATDASSVILQSTFKR